jgi:hypothetical protein
VERGYKKWLEDIPQIPDRDERIAEVLTDAYGEEEQLGSFETYLDDTLQFPFEAIWRDLDEKGHAEPVKVLGVVGSNLRRGVLLKIERNKSHKERQVEAEQIWPQAENSINAQILGDYRHWAGHALNNLEEYEEDGEE